MENSTIWMHYTSWYEMKWRVLSLRCVLLLVIMWMFYFLVFFHYEVCFYYDMQSDSVECLFGLILFNQMEMFSLRVKGCTIWHKLGTYGHLVVAVLNVTFMVISKDPWLSHLTFACFSNHPNERLIVSFFPVRIANTKTQCQLLINV